MRRFSGLLLPWGNLIRVKKLLVTRLVLLWLEVRRLNRRDRIINVFVGGREVVQARRAPWADDAVRRQELARHRSGSGR